MEPPGPETEDKARRAQAGHQEILGETIAKFELFRCGWNPYSRFLDHEKIDLVARKNTGAEILYADVQVKQSRLYRVSQGWARELFDLTSWGFFNPKRFEHCNPNLVVAMVLVHRETDDGASVTDYTSDMFIFGAQEFRNLLTMAVPSGDSVKVYVARASDGSGRWFWCKRWRKGMGLDDSSTVDVTQNRQAFHILDDLALRHSYDDRRGEYPPAMTKPEVIAGFLRAKKPEAYCDDCLYEELKLSTRQQAQVHTAAFAVTSDFSRSRGTCARCHEEKYVTTAV